jgi:hypothetical protein
MLYPWTKDQLQSTILDTIKLPTLIKKRTVLIAPEGIGKSSEVLTQAAMLKDGRYIYSTHTKANAKEKYNRYKHLNGIYHVKSDSELFEDIVYELDSDFGKIISSCSSLSQNKFLDLRVCSLTEKSDEIKQLLTWSVKYNNDRYKKCTGGIVPSRCYKPEDDINMKSYIYKTDNLESYKYNFDVCGKIQKFMFDKQHKTYYLFYRMTDLDGILTGEDDSYLKTILEDHINMIPDVNFILNELGYDWRCVRISTEIRNLLRFKKIERDNILKNSTKSNNFVLLIAQNKTTDKYIIPYIEDNVENWKLIQDEITTDMFKYMSQDELYYITEIAQKVWNNGWDSLLQSDKNKIFDAQLTSEFKKISKHNPIQNLGLYKFTTDFIEGIDCPSIKIEEVNEKPRTILCHRLSIFNNILILTSEATYPVLLKKFNFDIVEIQPDYKVTDTNFKICISNDSNELKIITSNKENKQNIIDTIHSQKKTGTIVIGTNSFDTDYSLEKCKGMNFDHTFEKAWVVKNPYPKNYFYKLLVLYRQLYPNATTQDLNSLKHSYMIDVLNQAMGRFCGYRDARKIEKCLFIHHTDSDVIDILEYLRYQGVYGNFDVEFIPGENIIILEPDNNEWDPNIIDIVLNYPEEESNLLPDDPLLYSILKPNIISLFEMGGK